MTVGAGALEHLTREQVIELMAKYYAGEAIASLLREFSIPCHASQLVQCFPPEVLDLLCHHCGSPLLRRRAARSSSWAQPAMCSSCQHQESPTCRCAGCRILIEKRERAQSERIATVIADYCTSANQMNAPATHFDEIAPVAAIALLALVRAADAHGDGRLSAVAETMPPFAPTATLSEELLMFLHSEGFIRLDPTSPPSAFQFDRHLEPVS